MVLWFSRVGRVVLQVLNVYRHKAPGLVCFNLSPTTTTSSLPTWVIPCAWITLAYITIRSVLLICRSARSPGQPGGGDPGGPADCGLHEWGQQPTGGVTQVHIYKPLRHRGQQCCSSEATSYEHSAPQQTMLNCVKICNTIISWLPIKSFSSMLLSNVRACSCFCVRSICGITKLHRKQTQKSMRIRRTWNGKGSGTPGNQRCHFTLSLSQLSEYAHEWQAKNDCSRLVDAQRQASKKDTQPIPSQ